MTLLQPAFLWSLLALVPLVLVYLLKIRPRRKQTTAYFLWHQVLEEKRSSSLLRRLRDVWSLLLMMLAFTAVSLALARPQWLDTNDSDLLILIDHSASMNARHGRASRLERAQDLAREVTRSLTGERRAAVASVGRHLRFQTHFTDSPRRVLQAIEQIQPTSDPFDRSVLERAVSGWSKQRAFRTILISDGCCGEFPAAEHVELLKVGESEANLGIVAADMRYLPGPDWQAAVYVQLASTADGPRRVDVRISRVDQDAQQPTESLRKLIPVSVLPGVNAPQQWLIADAQPGRWTVRLHADDVLADDDAAFLALDPPRPVRVAVQSSDRFFLENSVLAFARGNGLLALAKQDPTIVLTRSTSPDAGRAVIFQPAGDSPWWSEVGSQIEVVAPRVVAEGHPALRYIDFSSVPFHGARRLHAPDDAQIWVTSEQGVPLIYRVDRGGRAAVVVNMDPVAADFYYSAWFPVFVHSAALNLSGRQQRRLASYRPGSEVPIPGAQPGETTEVTAPDGALHRISEPTLPPLTQLGFYELSNRSGNWVVGCSLLSRQETLLDNQQVRAASRPVRRGRPLSAWLLIAAILLVSTESLLYHRRKVG